MKPFVMVAARDGDAAVAAEYGAVCTAGGLSPEELVLVRGWEESLADLDVTAYSAVIVGGSPYNASDEDKSDNQVRLETELGRVMRDCLDTGTGMLGICYGVGLITQQLGGVVSKDFGEPVSAVEVRVTEAGRRDPVLAGVPPTFRAFTGHKEGCAVMPDGAELLVTGDNPVQAYRIGDVYVTQFHPELDAALLADRMRIYVDHGYFDPEEMEDIIARAHAAGLGGEQMRVLTNFVAHYRR
ncbi:glutamine amidotransferase [Enemella sp. A6]|uniref:glutamine amidotransferase n=1 Tax=Enemella sp. A6 TaxID=3440152 RepID=UPI003EC049D4